MSYAKKNDYPRAKALGYNIQGIIKKRQDNLPSAVFYLKKCLTIFEALDDAHGIIGALGNIGSIYYQQENLPKAKEYYLQVLDHSIKEDILERLPQVQYSMGAVLTDEGNYIEAMPYLEKAQLSFEASDQKYDLALVHSAKGINLSHQGKKAEALIHINRALQLYKEIGNSYGLAQILSQKGNFELKQANYNLAIQHCTKAFDLAKEIGALFSQKSACQCLYDSYKALAKGTEALVQLEKLNAINQQLQKEESAKKLQEMEFEKDVLADSLATVEEKRIAEEATKKKFDRKTKHVTCWQVVVFWRSYLLGDFLAACVMYANQKPRCK